MGFFSWTCAKTNLPILAGVAFGSHPFTRATLLRPGRDPIHGTYDGYGNLGGVDLMRSGRYRDLATGRAKLVLTDFWSELDAFENIGRSGNDPGQGFFHADEFIGNALRFGSFPSYEAYLMAFDREVPAEAVATMTVEQAAEIRALLDSVNVALRKIRRLQTPFARRTRGRRGIGARISAAPADRGGFALLKHPESYAFEGELIDGTRFDLGGAPDPEALAAAVARHYPLDRTGSATVDAGDGTDPFALDFYRSDLDEIACVDVDAERAFPHWKAALEARGHRLTWSDAPEASEMLNRIEREGGRADVTLRTGDPAATPRA